MIIILKNKHSLKIDSFEFKCCVGKNGISIEKNEGDDKTPKGSFKLEHLYFRKDKIVEPIFTKIKKIIIKKDMGWCNDISSKKYNKLIKINKKHRHEKLYRKDSKYDLLVPIKYNFNNIKKNLGSCIFIHITNNYRPTAGCVGLRKNDFLILLKLISKDSRIIIH